MQLRYSDNTLKESKKLLTVLIIFLLIDFILRISTHSLSYATEHHYIDGKEYLSTAEMMQQGKYFDYDGSFKAVVAHTKRPFFYPLFLWLCGGHKSLTWIILLQTLLGIGFFYNMIRFYRRLHGRHPMHLLPWILLTPGLFIYAHVIMTEIWAMFLVMYLAVLLPDIHLRKKFLWLNIITAILPFIKPVFYPFVFIHTLLFLFYFILTKQKIRWIFLLPLTVVLLYLGYNHKKTGYTHFSSIENINLLEYNIFYFHVYKENTDYAENFEQSVYKKAAQYPDFGEKSRFIAAAATAEIKKDPVSYAKYHFLCALRGLIDPGRFDLISFFPHKETSNGFLKQLNTVDFHSYKFNRLWHYNALTQEYDKSISPVTSLLSFLPLIILTLVQIAKYLLIGIYVWDQRRKIFTTIAGIYMTAFLLYHLFITGPVAAARYVIPFQGILIVLATLGGEIGLRKWQEKRHQIKKAD